MFKNLAPSNCQFVLISFFIIKILYKLKELCLVIGFREYWAWREPFRSRAWKLLRMKRDSFLLCLSARVMLSAFFFRGYIKFWRSGDYSHFYFIFANAIHHIAKSTAALLAATLLSLFKVVCEFNFDGFFNPPICILPI